MQSRPLSTPRNGRLGIMGGSFDPPHYAHLLMAETVREALSLDLVLFVPARSQPLKKSRAVTPAADRLEMVRLAVEGNPCFALSTVDVDRTGPSYTVDTLRILREEWGARYPSMWFITGTDSLATLPQWHDPQGILRQARLAVVRRPGAEVDMPLLNAAVPGLDRAVDWVDAPLIQISSTELRHRAAEGKSLRYRLPEPVREYIEAHGLYRHVGETG